MPEVEIVEEIYIDIYIYIHSETESRICTDKGQSKNEKYIKIGSRKA